MGIREHFMAAGRKLIEEEYAWGKVLPIWEKTLDEVKTSDNDPYPAFQLPKQVNLEDYLDRRKQDRILYVMPGTFGDIFLSTAVIDSLKKKYPEKDIYFAVSPQFKGILEDNPNIHKLLDFDPIFRNAMVVNSLFDMVYQPYVETQSQDNWNWTRNGEGKHLAHIYADHCNVEVGKPFITLKEVKDLPAEFVVIHTNTGQEPKNYGEYQRVANRIALPVIQVGQAGDLTLVHTTDMRGRTIQETAYIISKAKLFIGGDSICAHLAGHAGTPMLLLYGSTYPKLTKPLGAEKTKLVTLEPENRFGCDRPCHFGKCFRGRKGCIDNISVQEIVKALDIFKVPTKEPPPATISGYTTLFNPGESYPWKECITSLLGFCDEVVVVDASTDNTPALLKEWKAKEPRLKVYKRRWREDEPMMDGMMKAYARALCTKEYCWQQDADEIVHEADYEKIKRMALDFPSTLKLASLPVLDFYGTPQTVRTDRGLYKWRLSRNSPEITHGIPKQMRKMNKAGKTYCDPNECDGCFPIHAESGEMIREQTTFVTQELLEAMQKDSKKYAQMMKVFYQTLPSIWHYSWHDLERRIKVDLAFWDKQWSTLGQVAEKTENRFFPGVEREKITPEMIKEKANFLKDKKLDGTPMELIRVDWMSPPAIIQPWLEKHNG